MRKHILLQAAVAAQDELDASPRSVRRRRGVWKGPISLGHQYRSYSTWNSVIIPDTPWMVYLPTFC